MSSESIKPPNTSVPTGGASPAGAPSPAPTAAAAPAGTSASSGAAPTSASATIPFDLFAKIDLRVATIKSAEFHPNADKLLKLRLDDGTAEGRQVCAGIRQWYDPATLVGRQVVIVANLEPRTIRGEISQGMVLAASDLRADGAAADAKGGPGERDVVILSIDRPVKAGSKVS